MVKHINMNKFFHQQTRLITFFLFWYRLCIPCYFHRLKNNVKKENFLNLMVTAIFLAMFGMFASTADAKATTGSARISQWLDQISPVLMLDVDSRQKKGLELFQSQNNLLALLAAQSDGPFLNQDVQDNWNYQSRQLRQFVIDTLISLNETDPRAGTCLGLINYYGLSPVQKSISQAGDLLKFSASRGDPEAMFRLAGVTTAKSKDKSARNEEDYIQGLITAAQMGHVSAQAYLGRKYHTGNGIEKDLKEAEKWLAMAAENGSLHSKSLVGIMVMEHGSDSIRPEKALTWLHQAASDQRFEDAAYYLGQAYYLGEKVQKNWQKAAVYLEKQSNEKEGEAGIKTNLMLAEMFDSGGYGLDADRKKSLTNLYFAAEKKNPKAILLISAIKYKAFNDTERLKNYDESDAGFPYIAPSERRTSGSLLLALASAVKAKEPGAAEFMGLISLIRLNISEYQFNRPKVANLKRWFEAAAEDGNPEAQFLFGILYSEAYGSGGDYEKARYWLSLSAASGLPEAQNALGIMYAKGLGGEKNEKTAAELFTKASEQGHQQAGKNLQKLLDRLQADMAIH